MASPPTIIDGQRPAPNPLEVLVVFARLGMTSFGGPVAHIGYFRAEIVQRRRWLDEAAYADLVALCQFLPGPSSSQVGIGIGMLRAGLPGALAAWAGFTLPSAVLLTLFALGVEAVGVQANAGWLHGLKIVALAVVAQAVWSMARSLCPDRARATIAIVAAIGLLVWPVAVAQLAAIALAGVVGWRLLPGETRDAGTPLRVPVSRRIGVLCWVVLGALLLALPLVREATGSPAVALVDTFFRVGSFVFGGGHVVLPLLQREVVPVGWVSNETFVAGYGAAQAVPGPLMTFSAFLGASRAEPPNGWAGAAVALSAIFLPSFFLVGGALPFWGALRGRPAVQSALRGINAAVVGILLAALYQPIWTSAIGAPIDLALALATFGLLTLWAVPPWLVVLLSAAAGAALTSRPG